MSPDLTSAKVLDTLRKEVFGKARGKTIETAMLTETYVINKATQVLMSKGYAVNRYTLERLLRELENPQKVIKTGSVTGRFYGTRVMVCGQVGESGQELEDRYKLLLEARQKESEQRTQMSNVLNQQNSLQTLMDDVNSAQTAVGKLERQIREIEYGSSNIVYKREQELGIHEKNSQIWSAQGHIHGLESALNLMSKKGGLKWSPAEEADRSFIYQTLTKKVFTLKTEITVIEKAIKEIKKTASDPQLVPALQPFHAKTLPLKAELTRKTAELVEAKRKYNNKRQTLRRPLKKVVTNDKVMNF